MRIARTSDQKYKPYSEEYDVKGIERADLWRDGENVSFGLFRIKRSIPHQKGC